MRVTNGVLEIKRMRLSHSFVRAPSRQLPFGRFTIYATGYREDTVKKSLVLGLTLVLAAALLEAAEAHKAKPNRSLCAGLVAVPRFLVIGLSSQQMRAVAARSPPVDDPARQVALAQVRGRGGDDQAVIMVATGPATAVLLAPAYCRDGTPR
jgi:hypothetical protein